MQLIRLESGTLNYVKETYNLNTLELYKVRSNYELLVYFVRTNTLDTEWEEINSSLTQGLDQYLNTFNKWNMYLIFITDEDISKNLQYKIENDTFAFRKIIEANYNSELNEANIKSLISEHILFTDLDIDTTSIELENYSSESSVWQNIISLDTLEDENLEAVLENLERELNEN